MRKCGFYLCASGQEHVAEFCEHGNETSGSITWGEGGEFIEYLRKYQLAVALLGYDAM